jgi:uncharacterized Fe-S cluster-containing protein
MRESKMVEVNEITKYLPGFNCGACGYKRCDLFAEALLTDSVIMVFLSLLVLYNTF